MTLGESVIQKIVDRVLSVTRPDKIILFGSAATDQMTRDSDIDLLIVESDRSDQREQYVRVRRALDDIRYPFDILHQHAVVRAEQGRDRRYCLSGPQVWESDL